MSQQTEEQAVASANGELDENTTTSVSHLPGPIKAALWMLSVDEDFAVNVLPHLREDELRLLVETANNLGKTTPEQLADIHREFQMVLVSEPLHLKGSADYLGKIAGRALGPDCLTNLFGPAPVIEETGGLGGADVEILATVLGREHPQVVAAVLANLPATKAAEILEQLPEDARGETIMRIAKLSRVPKVVLERAERLLSAGLPTRSAGDPVIDGVKAAASLLNQFDQEAATELLDSLDSDTSTVADDIRKAMFTFEDLFGLDRRGFQTLLKEVQSDQLLLALKTASEPVQNKIFDALSRRAAEMLREDLEIMGPARLKDVQDAQQAVVAVALQLKADGRLALAGSGEDFV